jgi:hypothetical protein
MAQALVQYEHRHPLGDREDLVALLDRVVGCGDPGVVAARCLSRLDLAELGALPVRPDPVARDGERALARFGLLGEGAAAAFAPGARYPLAGLLPGRHTGLLACARTVYGRLRNGFYGLETMLVFCALLREPRAEGATRVSLAALGRVLGLERAPEVNTIRRKLGELAATGRAEQLQMAIARHHAAACPDQLGFFYIDGHTRAYFGTRDVQKMHVARLKFPAPGTEETWVTDGAGDPAAGRDGPAVILPGHPDPRPAAPAPRHRRPGPEGDVVLRPGRLVPQPVRRHHRRRVPPAHLPQE